MRDFATTRAQLSQARTASAAAHRAVATAAQRHKALRLQIETMKRRANSDDAAASAEMSRLQAQLDQAADDLRARQEASARADRDARAALEGFATFSDPRRGVAELDSGTPFLLLPVRTETRFAESGDQHQLWVRIYPDDCSVDTFESTLSSAELANAKRYWEGIWSAGGVEADERGAWRGLVAAHGSGRAGWIVDNYQPVNPGDKPVKAAPTDEILVIPTQTPLDAVEASAISAYWQAIWLIDDRARMQAARSALDAAVGAARAADLITGYVPFNLSDQPAQSLAKSDVALSTAFIVFPPDPPTQQGSWTQAPRVNHLADRFVVLGYTGSTLTLEAIGSVVTLPMYVGPDPSAKPEDTIHADGPDLFVPDALQWLIDFDRAVSAGMGLRIDLTPDQARNGFDRFLVLGLQLSADATESTAVLEELLTHHHNGHSGLSLVPQGTPTHNTTGIGTGYTQLDNADQSFDDRWHSPLFAPAEDPMLRRDGDWLTRLLGIDPAVFVGVHGADGQDQMRARAMQCALWPATLGYWMDKMLTPVFSDTAVDQTRWFFTNYVSGCGPIPALRIGGQPYGILATTAFSRITWLDQPRIGGPPTTFLATLSKVLMAIGADWKSFSAQVPHVGQDGDAHQTLLDVVGLNPSSVEYHSRYAQSASQLFNVINLFGLGPDFWQRLQTLMLDAPALALLAKLGYTGAPPEILKQFFFTDSAQIGNVIDDVPLSEMRPLRACTEDGSNYIQWLIKAAETSLDTLYQEQGFSAGKTPETLLYLFLRHALTLGYFDTSYNLHRTAGFLSAIELAAMKPEPAFVHVAATGASESRFAALYKAEPRITSSPSLLVTDFITSKLFVLAESAGLADQLRCLETLKSAPTAALERAFAEHVDCCSHRYDAWLLGIVNYQLEAMRAAGQQGHDAPRRGLYLGAYAWVENLRPSTDELEPVQLPPDIAGNFVDTAPLLHDVQNGGYIHAPSLPHAKTAAVLRSGYLANASADNPGALAVNLSSDRVRLALSVLEGIRNGQSFGALLGYQFERGLHDDHGNIEVDKFIYPMRKAFPLVADANTTTRTDAGVPIEAIEARNVMDGMKLIERLRAGGTGEYPFGVAALPLANPDEAKAINTEVARLLDTYDAIADLALAEGVHQAVQGNFERVAATLDAYTSGHFPPDPQVVQSPADGVGLTQRMAVHFQSGLAAPAGATPRAMAEPALDAWLASVLPPLATIGCRVSWIDPATATSTDQRVSLADLGLRPIDLLVLITPDDLQSFGELDDRVLHVVFTSRKLRPDANLQIEYLDAAGAALSVFQVLPLVRCLKAIVARSRPLRWTDAMLGNATPDDASAVFADPARIAAPKATLDALASDISTFIGTLAPLLADRVANRAAIISGIDGFLSASSALLERVARFGIPSARWGFLYSWKQVAFVDLLKQIGVLVQRWQAKLASFDAKIVAYDGLPAGTADFDRFRALRAAQGDISTANDPLPATPALMRTALDVRRATFDTRLGQFAGVRQTSSDSFSATLAAAAAIATADLDAQPFDLTSFGDRAVDFAAQIADALGSRLADVKTRSADTQTQLDAAAAAGSSQAVVDAVQAAATALLGADFRIYPEFSLSTSHGAEWSNALAYSTSGLLTYPSTTGSIDFPIDEWLYGIARVRPNMRSWEQLLMLTDAFGVTSPSLVPAQFPYAAGPSWYALPFDPAHPLESDALLYTAHYSGAFDKAKRQCGLLLDEWTEVIPATTHDTGLTFNFDRPDNEAPQSFLLVTPASVGETWQWDDLVGALNETLDLAKVRAVEPTHLAETAYSRFVPATVMAATLRGISITTSFAAANGVFRKLAEG